jgi:hypothetical protein
VPVLINITVPIDIDDKWVAEVCTTMELSLSGKQKENCSDLELGTSDPTFGTKALYYTIAK